MKLRYGNWLGIGLWLACAMLWLWQFHDLSCWWQPLVVWAGFGLLAIITKRLGYDHSGLIVVCFLVSIGWLFLYRLSPSWAHDQFQGLLFGYAAYLLGLFGNWGHSEFKYTFGAAAVCLLLCTLLFGVRIGGAKAWLAVGSFRFQPVEFARVLLVLFLARYLADNQELLRVRSEWPIMRYWGPLLFLLSGVFLLLAVQRDLGPVLLVFFVYCTLSLLVVFSWRLLFLYMGAAVGGFMGAFVLFPHFRSRVSAWLVPWEYVDTAGYQVLQGLFALDAGSLFGKGLGYGMPQVIPEVHTDYVFAIIGEELGLLGTIGILLAYLCLTFWGMQNAASAEDGAAQYVGLGIVLLGTLQVFLVIGGILRILPFTGMTLPFISYGSSSLVAHMWMIGILAGLRGSKNELPYA
ncbi:MAG: FtsW/RodA/SpoVE family cell cycle protein [Firmicutes bacterium]|nr:FtsW/RodA/SpoVE family cell cycle protein [Bacillota bacterium]